MYSEKVRSAQSQLALASRSDRATPADKLAELKRDYATAKIAEFVEREIRRAPKLTEEQLAIISRAMRGTAASG